MRKKSTLFAIIVFMTVISTACDNAITGGNDVITYTVTYNANGGVGVIPEAQTFNSGTKIHVAGQGDLINGNT